MDKVLLTAFLSALAGFITAVISIVKLVNEKESKTTDYRQAWTDSIRKSLAELIASLNAQASQIKNEFSLRDKLNNFSEERLQEPGVDRIMDHLEKNLSELVKNMHLTRQATFESYAFSRLHFKPNDLSFNRIEQKFDILDSLLNDLSTESKEVTRAEIRQKIYGGTKEITDYARDILKTEWETVKRGEPAYQRTKKWSIGTSILMLLILLSIGIHVGTSPSKNENTTVTDDSKAKTDIQNSD
jgi:hypothetical protein